MRNRFWIVLGLATFMAASQAAHAGTPVNQLFSCSKGSFLIGFQGHIGAWIDQFQPVCAPWDATHQRLGPEQPGPVFGNSNGGGVDLIRAVCGPGYAAESVGYGLAVPNGPPGHVENLFVACTPIANPYASYTYAPEMGTEPGTTADHNSDCPARMLANNVEIGLDGTNIASLSLVCDTADNIMAAAPGAVVHPITATGAMTGGAQPSPAPSPIHHYIPGMFGSGPSPAAPAPAPAPTPVAVPPSDVIEGDWKSSEGPMTFTQNGHRHLDGTYAQDSGRIRAEREGGHWVGFWSEAKSNHKCDHPRLGSDYWGRMDFAFSDQNRHFDGMWSYCDAPAASGTAWHGDRIK